MAQYPTPVYPTFGQQRLDAVNSGFDSVMSAMQQAQQQKMQNLAFMGQTGYSPQDLLAGQNVGQQLQRMGNPQNQPGQTPVAMPGGQQIQIGQPPLPQSQMDMYQHFQNFLSQGQQKSAAGIADTQSQANQRNSAAAISNQETQNIGGKPAQMQMQAPQLPQNWSPPAAPQQPQGQGNAQVSNSGQMAMSASLSPVSQSTNPDGSPRVQTDQSSGRQYVMLQTKAGPKPQWLTQNSSELTPERQAIYDWALDNGEISQGELRSRGVATNAALDKIGAGPGYQAFLAGGSVSKPGAPSVSPMQSDFNMAAGKAKAVAPFSPGAFKVQASAASLLAQLPDARAAVSAMTSGNEKTVNRMMQAWGVETQDEMWDAVRQKTSIVADEMQAQIGAGSDQKLDLAVKLLDTTKSPKNIMRALDNIEQVSQSRKNAFGGDLSGAPPKAADQKQAAPKAGSPDSVITIIDSTGQSHPILRKNLGAARKRDPGLKVQGAQ